MGVDVFALADLADYIFEDDDSSNTADHILKHTHTYTFICVHVPFNRGLEI